MANEKVIGGYRLHRNMGNGQFSQVWEAVEISSNRHFAIKMLLAEHVDKADVRKELFHEAEVGLKLAHPKVIQIKKVDKSPKRPYFVMEFFPGGSLKMRLLHYEEELAFLKEQAQFIFQQAATALAYINAHGWVHRDVKPENFLVNSAGELKLIDFALAQPVAKGLSKLFHRKGPIQGTRSYMSPEQIQSAALDGRADIYSFGCTAYEVVLGRPPFRGANSEDLLNKHLHEQAVAPHLLNKDVTEEFSNLIMKCIAKNREDRWRNFHEVLMEMKKIRVFRSIIPKRDKRQDPPT